MVSVQLVLGFTTAVLAITLAGSLLLLRKEIREQEIEVDQERVKGAVSESWQTLELDKTIGAVEKQMESVQKKTEEIEDLHTDIETMLQSNQQRGEFGERKLEDLLSKHLPTDMYGLQKKVVGSKKPDAYIDSSAGKICIDAKFPLDSFRRMKDAENEEEREKYRREFRNAVEKTLDQVASKYVKPEEGTTEFAFEFVPSEAVYYHLVSEEYELLDRYVKKGVQVSSPLTLGHKLELIKSDLRMEELAEDAEQVKDQLNELQSGFTQFQKDWETFYDSHLQHLTSKADDLNSDFRDLRQRFDRVNLDS